ncbi:hypothetical protein OL239_02845 [Arthrobacter sp. ATA002]|nr:hypothetical protein [Arthrobacter sp. ATA002]WAP52258.1 hypothetical protein OL239_02845 [Arthrobacter sp. ATA002]
MGVYSVGKLGGEVSTDAEFFGAATVIVTTPILQEAARIVIADV